MNKPFAGEDAPVTLANALSHRLLGVIAVIFSYVFVSGVEEEYSVGHAAGAGEGRDFPFSRSAGGSLGLRNTERRADTRRLVLRWTDTTKQPLPQSGTCTFLLCWQCWLKFSVCP